MGEWLKPTDCKSVPPSEVRRFESFPVHQFEFNVNRVVAVATGCITSCLGVLTWTTISDREFGRGRWRFWRMFAVKTWLRRKELDAARRSNASVIAGDAE